MKKKNYFLFAFTAFLGFINLINAQSDSISKVEVANRNLNTNSNLAAVRPFWSVSGNSGTTAGVNFIGTTDNEDILFKRNNIVSGRIGQLNTSYGISTGQGGLSNVNIGRSAGSDSNHFLNFSNISIGESSGRSNISGSVNTFVGGGTGTFNTTGLGNTFIGAESGKFNTIGNLNTALGFRALKNNTLGSDNISLGNASLELNQSGNSNIALGRWSLNKNISGDNNIAIGISAGSSSIGDNNVFLGVAAGASLLTGDKNMCLGYFTGHFLRAGSDNIFIGSRSGYSTSQGSNNLFLGNSSGVDTGSKNIAIGENAGGKTGNGNILLGNNSRNNPGFQVNPLSDNILNIGNVIFGYNMNRLSSSDNLTTKLGQIGINTTIPKNTLEVKSEAPNTSGLRFTNLTSAFNPTTIGSTNKFLSVDSNGDVVLQFMPNLVATNELTSQANTMTSDVNGISSNATIVNSISNIFNANNQLITSVNGIASNPVTIPIPTFNEVDGSTTNELQTLSQAGNTITLSNGGGSFNLPTFTDTDEQSLSLSGNNLSISNGNTVVLPTFVEVDGSLTNELQTLSQAGNTITLSNGGGSFNLPTFTDTDAQSLSLSGNNLSISNGNTVVLPSFVEVDGSTTNELQTLSQAGNTITLSNGGGSFNLPTFTDTDAQSLSLNGNNLTISNGNTVVLPTFVEVDGSVTNELQTLSQAGNTITLSNGGGSFNLPTFTDAQSLTLTGNTLSISNGNSVVFPTTNVVGGTNVTVTGNGSNATPFLVSSIDTSLYVNNGTINQATTVNNNRVVNMNSRNIWFDTSSSTSNGNIYIGSSTSYPNTTGNYKLFVEGGILTEKVKVALRSTANWADYVFEKDYKLMPLNEVEKYISTNQHLPGVDSASDLSKNGLDLAEMQAKHMEKIEELTLYAIEQNKKIELQDLEIKKTNKEVEELKAQVKALIEKTK